MVMVAAGEPGGGTACCANDGTMADAKNSATRILRIGMAKSSPNGAMEHNLGSRCPLGVDPDQRRAAAREPGPVRTPDFLAESPSSGFGYRRILTPAANGTRRRTVFACTGGD